MKKLTSSKLKSAILGMVLGDAYIDTSYKDCRLDIYVDHKHKDFAELKYNILTQVGNLKVNMVEKYDKRKLKDGSVRHGYRIQTHTHKYITKLKNIPLFKKPEMLDELGLAIWYMDDGSLSIRRNGNYSTCYIAMNRYPVEFVEHCIDVFYKNFNFKGKIQRHSLYDNQYLLRLTKSEAITLHDIVRPYIVESMNHKLLNP